MDDKTATLVGQQIGESYHVPRDTALKITGGMVIVHPYTMLLLRFKGKLPFECKYSVGMSEVRREQRLRRRS